MNRFEDEVRWALQRREPPAGFADRLMARIPAGRPKRSWIQRLFGAEPTRRRLAPVLAGTLVAVLAAGTWQYRQVEQRREGEMAKQELIYALQLTSSTLQSTKTKLLQNMGGQL